MASSPPPSDPPTTHHPPPLGEKMVAGIPWRYGDPESAFEWDAVLGEGSRSTVRAATRVSPPPPGTPGAPQGTRCAVKVLSKSHPRFSALDARSEVEAHAAAAVCTDAVTLQEVWEDDDAVYLVQAVCDGGELYERVRAQGRLPEPDAAAAAAAVLRLLAHMHAGGWVHRDVKLENFLYAGAKGGAGGRPAGDGASASTPGVTALPLHSTRGRLLGVDFGSATRLAPGEALTGPPAGSVPYLSPEAVAARADDAGAAVGAPADLWSAGCVLFALLSGQLPFGGDTDADVLAAIAGGVGGVPRGAAWSRVSDEAVDLVRHLLARDPAARPSAVDALQHPWLLAGGECGADGGPRAPLSRAEARARAKEAAREAAAEARGRLASVAARVRETRERWRARRASG